MTVYFGMAAFLCAGAVLWKEDLFHGEQQRLQLCRNLFLTLAALLFIITATFRYGIGYDYFNYQNLYARLGPLSVQELLHDHVAQEFIGYSLLMRGMYLLGFSYRALLLTVNTVLTAIVFFFITRYSKLPWLGAYLYLTLQFFAHSMNLFRQSIAATICLLAYPFLKKRKFFPFFAIVLLAASFHLSALFLLPFYWVLSWKVDGRIYAAISAAALSVYLFSTQAAQFLTNYLFPNYAGYIGSRYWAGLGYRYIIFPAIYFGAVWFCRKRLLEKDPSSRFLINSSFYVLILYVFSTHHMILERFSIYLFMYAMILLPELAASFYDASVQNSPDRKAKLSAKQKQEQQRQNAFLAAVLIVIVSFGYLLFASQQGSNGFHKVYPYVSVWDTDD